jgi:hypothetical protein
MKQIFRKKAAKYICALLATLLFTVNVYAYYERNDAPAVKKNETTETKKQQPTPQQSKPDYKQLYEESLNWFPESTPPLLREFLKDPDNDELAGLVRMYLNEIVDRTSRAGEKMAAKTAVPNKTNIVSHLDRLGKQGYAAKYFYSDPYVNEPFLNVMSNFMPVERILVSMGNKEKWIRWKIETTPTLFLIKGDRAYKMAGEVNETTLAEFISGLPQ